MIPFHISSATERMIPFHMSSTSQLMGFISALMFMFVSIISIFSMSSNYGLPNDNLILVAFFYGMIFQLFFMYRIFSELARRGMKIRIVE
jgi:hypothetical protein